MCKRSILGAGAWIASCVHSFHAVEVTRPARLRRSGGEVGKLISFPPSQFCFCFSWQFGLETLGCSFFQNQLPSLPPVVGCSVWFAMAAAGALYLQKFDAAVKTLQDSTSAHIGASEALGATHLDWLQTALADVWMGITGEKPVGPAGVAATPAPAALSAAARASTAPAVPVLPFALPAGGAAEDGDGCAVEDVAAPARSARLSTVGIAGRRSAAVPEAAAVAAAAAAGDVADALRDATAGAHCEEEEAVAAVGAGRGGRRGAVRPPLPQKGGELLPRVPTFPGVPSPIPSIALPAIPAVIMKIIQREHNTLVSRGVIMKPLLLPCTRGPGRTQGGGGPIGAHLHRVCPCACTCCDTCAQGQGCCPCNQEGERAGACVCGVAVLCVRVCVRLCVLGTGRARVGAGVSPDPCCCGCP